MNDADDKSKPLHYGFEYEVKMAVSIPIAWAILLKEAAKHHYDYKCREIGERGIINGLYNTAHDGEWPSTYAVTFGDLNITAKVAEQLRYHTDDHALIVAISRWINTTMAAIERQRVACMELPGSAKAVSP